MGLGDIRVKYRGRQTKALRALLRRRGIVAEFRQAFVEINKVYRKFLVDRYRRFSKGGGNWKKLKPSTIARKGHDTILVDEKIMIREFSPEIVATENIFKPSGRVGFKVDTGLKIRRAIGGYHQEGAPPRLPQRKIVVGPDDATANKIARIIEKYMGKYLKRISKNGD